MNYEYETCGTCSKKIRFDLNNNLVSNVSFEGGCNGNLKAISKLVEGMEADKLISILEGNTCGFRDTSCADQLAKAVKEALEVSSAL